MQVETLHQEPVEVRHDTVLEEHQAELAADLEPGTARECASRVKIVMVGGAALCLDNL